MDGPAGNRDAAQKDSPIRDHAAEPRVTTGVVVASHGPRWLTGSAAPLTNRPRSPGARSIVPLRPPQLLPRRTVIPSRTPLARNLPQCQGQNDPMRLTWRGLD